MMDCDIPMDLHIAVDEPDDVVRWVPSQTSNPVLQDLIRQAEEDRRSMPIIPSKAEPLWTHTLSSTTCPLWPSSTAPSASRTLSPPSLANIPPCVSPVDPSGSDPSSASSRRIKPSSAHVQRKPLSASANHTVRLGRITSKHNSVSKRPRSSSHSATCVAEDNRKANNNASLADREQDPDAAAFLALLRDVSRQLDENAKKKQCLVGKVRSHEQKQKRDGDVERRQSPAGWEARTPPNQCKGKGKEQTIEGASTSGIPPKNSLHDPNLAHPSVPGKTDRRLGKKSNAVGVPCRNAAVVPPSSINDSSSITPVQPAHVSDTNSLMSKSISSASRNLTRASSLDINMSTRQVPVLNARGLSRTSSASTVTPVSHRSGTVSPLVELTSDEGVEGTAKDVGKDDRMAISTVMIQDFMAIDVDVSSGDDFDKNFDMNISTDLKESALPTASHANSIVPVQLQPSFGQGRPSTQRPPQLGMRRPALLSANPHHSTAYPMSSQYSTPSQVRKGTVPRFKPPLLNTATAASRARVERSSTSIASTDPQTDSGIRGAHKAIPQRQNGTSSAPLKADPDSSFDISLELDVDVLEEAMRPYDQKTW